MISTKGRYSIRILLDLAEHPTQGGGPFNRGRLPPAQNFSLKRVGGGWRAQGGGGWEGLSTGGGGVPGLREPDQYTLWEILRLAEGDLAPVACLQSGAAPCARAADCRTLSVGDGYYKLSREYFSGVTLADLMREPRTSDYVI